VPKNLVNACYDAEEVESIRTIQDVPRGLIRVCEDSGLNLRDANDAEEVLTFARQLEYVSRTTYDKKYPDLIGRSLVPISREAGPLVETIAYRMYDRVTAATLGGTYNTVRPSVALSASEGIVRFHDYENEYHFDLRELRMAQAHGIPLDTKTAAASREGMERAVDRAIAVGEGRIRTYGLLNNPGVSIVSLTTGNWLNPATTGVQILNDLNLLVRRVNVDSKQVESVTDIIMGIELLDHISTKLMSTTTDTGWTVRQAFEAQRSGVALHGWDLAATANPSGGNRVVAYNRSDDVMRFEMGLEYEVLGPQARGWFLDYFARGRWAGLNIFRPGALRYADNA
jgi:hypothetical protein